MSDKRINRGLLALLYVLAFVLLREWILPVSELSNMGHLALFLLFIVLSFIFSLARLSWWFSGPVKIIYIFGVIHYAYFDRVLLSKETVRELFRDVLSNFVIIVNADWEGVTNPFRTILFFVLLWMTTYLIRYWIEARKSIFLFYAMTVIFIAFVDTFSEYSADGSIFRVMVTGILLLGLLYITKLAEKHEVKVSTGTLVTIAVPLLFLVAVSGVFANVLPKQEPFWPDPVPYFQTIVEGTGEGSSVQGMAKSGYDPDNTLLGGPFMEDNTLVFEAEVDRRQYWKIETKNTYTSKGWEQLPVQGDVVVYSPGTEMGEEVRTIDSEEMQIAQITMVEKFPFLIYPYGMTKAFAEEDAQFIHLYQSGQYRTMIDNSEMPLDSYEMHFVENEYSLKELRATTMDSYLKVDEDLSEYLQLPELLPERVQELAKSITEMQESVYDKTKEIERYFAGNGFVYDKKDVGTPGEEEDYVDQFLFDTKRGYCDNFSTSMVVMLRSIGIPARWAIGFAPGAASVNEEGDRIFQVTNNEAHSWVEAYMPGLGWMPFEPTIGFSGPTDIDYDLELEENDPEIPERKAQELSEPEKPAAVVTANKDFDFSKMLGFFNSWKVDKIWIVLFALGVSAFATWRVYRARNRWIPKILIPVYRSGQQDWDMYSKRYKSLLKQLDRYGVKRRSGVTLSSYALEVDTYFGGDEMRQLTAAYELGLYGEDITNHDWQGLSKMWEDLFNRTSG